MSNKNLHTAKRTKNDEFYTHYHDVESEILPFLEDFKNKVVLMNCNDTGKNFWKVCYNLWNHNVIQFKKLIATGYGINAEKWETTDGKIIRKTILRQSGDCFNEEGIQLLQEADIVFTNPPFSKMRDYIDLLIQHRKKFLIIGPMGLVSYKNTFLYMKQNKMWVSYNELRKFGKIEFVNEYNIKKAFGNIIWWTNLDFPKRHEDDVLTENYEAGKYPIYDNYDAINVDKCKLIPKNYNGKMGVPISYITKISPEQFEIIDMNGRYSALTGATPESKGKYLTQVVGVKKFKRLIIKKKVNDLFVNGKPKYMRMIIKRKLTT